MNKIDLNEELRKALRKQDVKAVKRILKKNHECHFGPSKRKQKRRQDSNRLLLAITKIILGKNAKTKHAKRR